MLFYTKVDCNKDLLVNGMKNLSLSKLKRKINIINMKGVLINKDICSIEKLILFKFYKWKI